MNIIIKFLSIISLITTTNISCSASITLNIMEKNKRKPYSCIYIDDYNANYNDKKKSSFCSNISKFGDIISEVSSQNFTISSANKSQPSSNDLANIGLQPHASKLKLSFKEIHINCNINDIHINGDIDNHPVVEFEISSCDLPKISNINFHLLRIPYFFINVIKDSKCIKPNNKKHKNHKIIENTFDSNNLCFTEERYLTNNTICLGINGIEADRYTILESNLPIKINGKVLRNNENYELVKKIIVRKQNINLYDETWV